MEYFFIQDTTIITEKTAIAKILLNNIPPKPVFPRKNLTTTTFEKLNNSELLLNFIPANTAQKIHTPITININPAKDLCLLIGSIKEYENFIGGFIYYIYY